MQMTDSMMLLTQMFSTKSTLSGASSQQAGKQEDGSSFRELMEQKQPASRQQSPKQAHKPEQSPARDEVPQDAPVQTAESEAVSKLQLPTADAIPTVATLPTAPATIPTAGPSDGPFLAENAIRIAPQTPQAQTFAQVQVKPQVNPQVQAQPQSPLPQDGKPQTTPQMQQPLQPQTQLQAQPQVEAQQLSPRADFTLTQQAQQNDLTGPKNLASDKPLFSAGKEVTVRQGEEAPTQPLFQKLEGTPIKVGETQTADTEAPDFTQQLAKQVNTALEKGAQRVEIQLTPEHLGKLTIELTRSQDGSMRLVLHASTERAANLLSEHSTGLASLLRGNSQSPVQVEVQQQNQEQGQREDQQQQQHSQQQQHHQRQQQQTQDFLQQLRLGILPLETEAS